MNEKQELLKHIYEDAEMAVYSIEELLKDLKTKDNKIKSLIEELLKDYQKYQQETKKLLKEYKQEISENSLMAKMGAKMGIMKDVANDNSDSSIADMLIKGISMGTIDMEKKISNYEKETEKDIIKFAKEFKKFQEKSIEQLKEYL